jgi:hypothetical protein
MVFSAAPLGLCRHFKWFLYAPALCARSSKIKAKFSTIAEYANKRWRRADLCIKGYDKTQKYTF